MERKIERVTFLAYLKRREQKREPIPETDQTAKRESLLTHRFVIVESIAAALQALRIPHAIIGGHAVTSHGRPRMTDDIGVLVTPQNAQAAVAQLHLRQVSPLRPGGYGGVTPEGVRIDVISPNQPWVASAVSQPIQTPYGPMVTSPFLVIIKLWDSRGSQDETDVLGVLKRMSDANLNATRQLVKQYLPNDIDDLESLIAMRNYSSFRTPSVAADAPVPIAMLLSLRRMPWHPAHPFIPQHRTSGTLAIKPPFN